MSAFSADLFTRLLLYIRLIRLDKPIGSLLLLWPTLWALWLAGQGRPAWSLLAIFVAGTVLMRSAGCVMNDLADRKFDSFVARTRLRPLATGAVSVTEALMLALGLSLLALMLVWQLNTLTRWLALLALMLAASYPFTKRFFALPQAYLGIAYSFGIPMAFAALQGSVPALAWLLLLANVFWTIAYDTEYAMVDRQDDLKIGICSSAITFGRYDVWAIMFCYSVALLLLLAVGWLSERHTPFFVALFVAALIAVYHYSLIRHRERSRCFQAFLHNNWLGAVIFIGLVLDFVCYG